MYIYRVEDLIGKYFFLFQLFIRFLGEDDNNYRWYNLRQ